MFKILEFYSIIKKKTKKNLKMNFVFNFNFKNVLSIVEFNVLILLFTFILNKYLDF